MPSFDIVSKVEKHELQNAVDQANREIDNRFDFRGTDAKFTQEEDKVVLTAPSDFQLKQMLDILQTKLTKRGIDILSLDIKDPQVNLSEAKQEAHVKQGIETPFAKELVKKIKETKIKVQASIQGEQVRVTGKKRDDLQEIIGFLKAEELKQPVQFENFRD